MKDRTNVPKRLFLINLFLCVKDLQEISLINIVKEYVQNLQEVDKLTS